MSLKKLGALLAAVVLVLTTFVGCEDSENHQMDPDLERGWNEYLRNN